MECNADRRRINIVLERVKRLLYARFANFWRTAVWLTLQMISCLTKLFLILLMFCTPLCRHHPQRRSTTILGVVHTRFHCLNTSLICLTSILSQGRYTNTVAQLSGSVVHVVVSALGMRTRRPRFESRVAPLFHWVATLGKLFTHITSPVSQLQETGVQKGVFGA